MPVATASSRQVVKVVNAPTNVGSSTTTTSPGFANARQAVSIAACEPGVMTTRSGSASGMPSAAITAVAAARISSVPWPGPYCRDSVPNRVIRSEAIRPSSSRGRSASHGFPPASEMRFGSIAMSKTSRTADCFTPTARWDR